MDVAAELLQDRAHDVAPERREVVALVEHDRPDARGAQRLDPLPRPGRQQLAEVQLAVRAARDLALEPGDDPRELLVAPLRRRARPRRRAGRHGGDGLARGPRPLLGPARLGRGAQRVAGIVEPRERLVGQARHRGARPVGDEPGGRAERRSRRRPLLLDGRVRREHQRGPRRAGAGSRTRAASCRSRAARSGASTCVPPPGRARTPRARASGTGAIRRGTRARPRRHHRRAVDPARRRGVASGVSHGDKGAGHDEHTAVSAGQAHLAVARAGRRAHLRLRGLRQDARDAAAAALGRLGRAAAARAVAVAPADDAQRQRA